MIRSVSLVASLLGLIAVGLASPAVAEPDPEDSTFARLLDNDGVLFNFRLERSEGQQYCEALIGGANPNDAVHELMRDGGYTFDVANALSSAASTSYCQCAFLARENIQVQNPICSPFEMRYGRQE